MALQRALRNFPDPGHDHARCAAQALVRADQLCEVWGIRLTDTRRRVLESVWESHAPIGAYDILAKLNAGGGRHAPMAVYRALDFLLANGLVHRIDSRNAVVGCTHPEEKHRAQFLICSHCGVVAEIASKALDETVRRAARVTGFRVDSVSIEATGRCPNCVETNPP